MIALLNVNWKLHMSNEELYGNLPKITDTICEKQMYFNIHWWRSKEFDHPFILWAPNYEKRSRDRLATTIIDQLIDNTRIKKEELRWAELWMTEMVGKKWDVKCLFEDNQSFSFWSAGTTKLWEKIKIWNIEKSEGSVYELIFYLKFTCSLIKYWWSIDNCFNCWPKVLHFWILFLMFFISDEIAFLKYISFCEKIKFDPPTDYWEQH